MSDFEPPGGPPSPPPPPSSDEPPQPGWWKASDGNWYPPDQAPQRSAPPSPPSGQPEQQPLVPPPPGGQGYGQPYGQGAQGYQPYTGGTPTNGIATWSLGLGIASIVLFWTFGFGILLGILAIIFGVMGGNKAKALPGELHAGRAKAGLITGVLGCIGGALFFVFVVVVADEVIDDVIQEIEDEQRDGVCDPNGFRDPDC